MTSPFGTLGLQDGDFGDVMGTSMHSQGHDLTPDPYASLEKGGSYNPYDSLTSAHDMHHQDLADRPRGNVTSDLLGTSGQEIPDADAGVPDRKVVGKPRGKASLATPESTLSPEGGVAKAKRGGNDSLTPQNGMHAKGDKRMGDSLPSGSRLSNFFKELLRGDRKQAASVSTASNAGSDVGDGILMFFIVFFGVAVSQCWLIFLRCFISMFYCMHGCVQFSYRFSYEYISLTKSTFFPCFCRRSSLDTV